MRGVVLFGLALMVLMIGVGMLLFAVSWLTSPTQANVTSPSMTSPGETTNVMLDESAPAIPAAVEAKYDSSVESELTTFSREDHWCDGNGKSAEGAGY